MSRTLTGRHVAAIFVAGFGVVIAVNLWMAHLAGSTFGGVVVENSYVASQHFNRWLEEADAERRLGWAATLSRDSTGRLVARTSAIPEGARVTADIWHPLGRLPDRRLALEPLGQGMFASREALPAGRWAVRLTIHAAGRNWNSESEVR